jgi:ribonucleoside-diphosphate reductase alpha chain
VLNLGDNEELKNELSSIRITAPINNSNTVNPKAVQKPVAASTNLASGMEAQNRAFKDMQSDAPACSTCGHITVRSGTCYKCMNCGTSLGCS